MPRAYTGFNDETTNFRPPKQHKHNVHSDWIWNMWGPWFVVADELMKHDFSTAVTKQNGLKMCWPTHHNKSKKSEYITTEHLPE